ncbi:Fur family transcriptional regulator [Williamsoniiplasma luminosum]|uniref:Fur family transcriptional regulator n=1 Tax=Williamsoniiplasma luminosum TaxID=214888 RepID=A0A2K8NT83_9MOLU|nr:transcriptional repressor [Williamsoniiplasma luminosum]ATZ17050.1 Fur family transcriptional regulator [Williamsoniiplasma luminosum]AVP49716.1 MAG: Fur family transcriptional regulator [Williamsoniiplasma luminosum]
MQTSVQEKKYEEIIAKLKKEGIRVTKVRSQIIKVIIMNEHPTINDIRNKLEERISNINVMSIYNTLDLLLEKHLLFANTFNGKEICYEIQDLKSVHLKCDNCLTITHIDAKELESMNTSQLKELAIKHGLLLDHFKIEIHGLCKKCNLQ